MNTGRYIVMRILRVNCFLILFNVAILSSCSTPQKADFLDPRLADNVKTISLFPAIDVRENKSLEIDLETHVINVMRDDLEEKGYSVRTDVELPPEDQFSYKDLLDMDAEKVCDILKTSNDGVLLVFIHDIIRGSSILSENRFVRLSERFLWEKEKRDMLKHESSINVAEGGFVNVLITNIISSIEGNVNYSSQCLAEVFPDKK